MKLENALIPVPLLVQVGRFMVGFGDVSQQTPLAVIGVPPSEEMMPPLVACVAVTAETGTVVS
jgi:hypothetical protein